jgi:riboflavin synthase, alpha subunit/riboflavin biosynthesis protein RibD
MGRALELAWNGWGRVAPNPLVGAVVLQGDELVGEGFHAEFGERHAEVAALEAAGSRAAGSTVLVTLEPCNHQGKQPPCTGALIKAGVREVVAAVADPNPEAGGGAAALISQGIKVEIGLRAEEASRQNAAFLHQFTGTERPFVALKLATTLDGKIADHAGRSRWISGAKAREFVHWLRAGYDAIGVGGYTARTDDASLTARGSVEPRIPPKRGWYSTGVGDLPASLTLVKTAREIPTLSHHSAGFSRQAGCTRIGRGRGAPERVASLPRWICWAAGGCNRCSSKEGAAWPERCSPKGWLIAITGFNPQSGSATVAFLRSKGFRVPPDGGGALAGGRASCVGRRHPPRGGQGGMFTGIVTAVGSVRRATRGSDGLSLEIAAPYADLAAGESIAVDGACLTVERMGEGWFSVHVIKTSLERTNFGSFESGRTVNLERALQVGERLGGHLVQGHVDGVGTVERVSQQQDARLLDIRAPAEVAQVSIPLGSVTVDGVSLTVNALPAPNLIQVSLIPFTLQHTTLGQRQVGDRVHLEATRSGST